MKHYKVVRDVSTEALEEILNRWSNLNWVLENLASPSPTTYDVVFSLVIDDLMSYLNSDKGTEDYYPEPEESNGDTQKKAKKGPSKKRKAKL